MADRIHGNAPNGYALLLHPPYGDFTYPYHSLSYVAAALESCGVHADVLDINALWFRRVFDDAAIRRLTEEIEAELGALEKSPALEIESQGRLADLLRAKAICASQRPSEVREILTSEAFYRPDDYFRARAGIRAFEALLNILYGPYDFLNSFSSPHYEPNADQIVEKVASSARWRRDLRELLIRHAPRNQYRFIGVSMPFSTNLVPGFCLLDVAGEVFPGIPRIAGGTAVTDVVKYCDDDDALAPFRQYCEGMFVGEAESGLQEMLDWLPEQSGSLPAKVVIPGEPSRSDLNAQQYVALRSSETRNGRFAPFDWSRHPPRYDWIDWSLYLAPEKRINYAPVRGCFWNKCTFCDYGLNSDLPTAPSRHMDVETAIRTVDELRAQGIHHFYLAADALPPNFLRRFAEQLIVRELNVHWSCELYLTHNFDREFVDILERSGLRQASFGLESGSERILEAMGKGRQRVARVLQPVLNAFRESSIALQPLFFFGFPGETSADRQATVDLLLEYRDLFTPISRGGSFALLAGSAIARNPAEFGVTNLRRAPGDEFGGILDYDQIDDAPVPDCADFQSFNDQLPFCDLFERPWAGGIDTLHTQLWVERHGRGVFEQLRAGIRQHNDQRLPVSITSGFDVEELIQNVLIDRTARARPEDALPASMQPLLEELRLPIERGDERRYELAVRPFGGMFSA